MTVIMVFEYVCILLGALTTIDVAAQNYPLKPVRFVAPYPAGGVNDIVAQFAEQGVEPAHSTPGEFAALIRSDLQKWGKVIEEAGIPRE